VGSVAVRPALAGVADWQHCANCGLNLGFSPGYISGYVSFGSYMLDTAVIYRGGSALLQSRPTAAMSL